MTAQLGPERPSLPDYVAYFLRLGTLGFGGPIALVGAMQRDLVETRGWVTERQYREGLALAQLAPGPLAAQLAIYLGWVRAGALGATIVGVAFVLPSFLMVVGLAWLYLRYGGMPWMQRAFYGVGAAVIAVILRSAAKLARMTLKKDPLLWVLFFVSAVITALAQSEIFWLFVGSGLVTAAWRRRPEPSRPSAAALVLWPVLAALVTAPAWPLLWTIAWFFAQAGLVVFGSGLAIVPFLHGGVVQRFGWLSERQFLDAVAVAMITPGPVVITVAFIGYLVAALPGAIVAAAGIFLPVYLAVVLVAPSFSRLATNSNVRAFVDGVTAAATGAILGAVYLLGRRAVIDSATAAIAAGTLLVLVVRRRVPEPLLMLGAGLLGLALRP